MKTLWIADFSLAHHLGGAQRSDQILVDKGIELGYNIVRFYHDSPVDLLHQKYELVISSNLDFIKKKHSWFNEWLCEQPNHIRHEHDSHQYNSFDIRKQIFDSTKLSIFVSELHMQKFVEHYGVNPKKCDYIVDCINTKLFNNWNKPREDIILYVGTFHNEKGTDLFLQEIARHPHKKYMVAGFSSFDRNLLKNFPNVSWYHNVSYEDMPKLYNYCKQFWFYPRGAYPLFIEPFCRSTAEAILCGCEMNVGYNIGSYELYKKVGLEQFRNMCENSSIDFWNKVESVT